MSGIFGTKAAAQQAPPVAGLQLQTSGYGKPIPLVFGANRIAPNLIWYGDFLNSVQKAQAGKGGVFDRGKQDDAYTYFTACAFALCEGPIAGYGTIYADKKQLTTASLGFSEFLGSYPQAPWGYLTTNHPSEAFPYNGVAYLANQSYALGTSAQLPNHNVEVFGFRYHSVSGSIPDADPSLVVSDILTNAKFGVPNFSTWMGPLTAYQNYALAAGLLISPTYESQRSARDIIDEIAVMTNSEVVYLSTGLTLVPRGDEALTGNGKTYTPPTAVWDLSDDDFLPSSGGAGGSSGGNSPIRIVRKRPSDILNSVRLECLDRTKQYQPTPVEAKDQAAIDTYGLRQQGLKSAHLFCDLVAGRASAQLQLQRQAIGNLYYFSLDLRFVFLEPMDILTLTHAAQGLSLVAVRIRSIQKKGSVLSFECEEYLAGNGSAANYSFQQGQGFAANYNVAPGSVNRPIIFEPTFDLGGAMEIWAAISGADTAHWGGCEVWASYDGATYSFVDTQIGAARMGVLTSPLATIAGSAPTIDDTHTLAVDVSESAATLPSVTQADELAGNALCYVDGELISYRDAILTSAGHYNIVHMLRGMYGTDGVMATTAHPIGSDFARVDGKLFRIPYDQTRIGATVALKFLSFNNFGQAKQGLADVSPYTYTIRGLLKGTTTVAGFAVSPIDVVSANGGHIPGLQCTWTPITNTSAVAVVVEYFPDGAPTQSTQVQFNNPAVGIRTISAGLQSNTTYFVRATLITSPTLLPTSWTGYVQVTTGNQVVTQPLDTSPDVPTGIALSNLAIVNADGSIIAGIAASWNAVTSPTIDSYDVQLNTGAGFVSAPTATNNYTWKGLTIGTTASVRVRSVSRLGAYSAFSATASLVVTGTATAPNSPTITSVQAAIRNVFLTWTNPAAPDLAYTEIWMATVDDLFVASLVGTTSGSAFVHSGLISATAYYYWIKSVNSSGLKSNISPNSRNGIGVTTLQADTPDIAVGAIVADRLAAGSVIAGKIAAGAVEADKLAAASVTAGKIAVGAVNAGNIIVDNIVVTGHLVADAATKLDLVQNGSVAATSNGATYPLASLSISVPAGGSIGVVIASVDLSKVWGSITGPTSTFDQLIDVLIDGVFARTIIAPCFASGPTSSGATSCATKGHFEVSHRVSFSAGVHTISLQTRAPNFVILGSPISYTLDVPTIISFQRFR